MDFGARGGSAPTSENLRFEVLARAPDSVKTPRVSFETLATGPGQGIFGSFPGNRFGYLFYEITARPRPPKSGAIRTTFYKENLP